MINNRSKYKAKLYQSKLRYVSSINLKQGLRQNQPLRIDLAKPIAELLTNLIFIGIIGFMIILIGRC